MHIRVLRPAAAAASLALTIAVGLAPSAASAQQQTFGRYQTQNYGQRSITGTVTYFNQYDLRIAANGRGAYGGGYNNGNGHGHGYGHGHGRGRHHGNGNGNQNWNDRGGNGQDRDDQDRDDQGRDGQGQHGQGQYGQGQYGQGQYGQDVRIHLHQGTVINPRGTTLQNGMQLRIQGHANSDGTFEADRIDVVGNGQYGYGNGYGNGYRH